MSNEFLGFVLGFIGGAVVLWFMFGGSLAFAIGVGVGTVIVVSIFRLKKEDK